MQLVCKNEVHRLQMDSKGTGYTGTDVQGWLALYQHFYLFAAQHKQLQQSFHKLPTIYIIILKLALISLAELVPRLCTRGVGSLEREQTITLTWCKMEMHRVQGLSVPYMGLHNTVTEICSHFLHGLLMPLSSCDTCTL